MRKLQQTRIHNPSEILGNCFPTVIACFLDLNSPEDVIQIQEKYLEEDWNIQLFNWLKQRGWIWKTLDGHLYDDSFYTVTGKVERSNVSHICIYKNGKLYHDPNPCNEGLITEDIFETFLKEAKVCFKCETMKPLSEYYKHKQMGDGLLGKCKDCTKNDTKQQTEINISTPEGLEKERERHRDKYHRLGYKDIHKPSPEAKRAATVKHREKYPEKYKAKCATANMLREKGKHLHHWSYNKEHWKDCFEISVEEHGKVHRFLVYDKKSFYYRNLEGNLLDTKEKHENYIKQLGIEIKQK